MLSSAAAARVPRYGFAQSRGIGTVPYHHPH